MVGEKCPTYAAKLSGRLSTNWNQKLQLIGVNFSVVPSLSSKLALLKYILVLEIIYIWKIYREKIYFMLRKKFKSSKWRTKNMDLSLVEFVHWPKVVKKKFLIFNFQYNLNNHRETLLYHALPTDKILGKQFMFCEFPLLKVLFFLSFFISRLFLTQAIRFFKTSHKVIINFMNWRQPKKYREFFFFYHCLYFLWFCFNCWLLA